jgi:serine-type D-Ala-D-Ala carboxypeptidase
MARGLVNTARVSRALDVLKLGIADGVMPGATVCAIKHGEVFLHEAIGTLDGERPTALDSIYDLASITKPMATGASVLNLVEDGRLALTTTLPELFGKAASHFPNVTVRHLLTHTSGLPAWTPCYDNGPGHDAAIEAILRLPSAPVGTKYEYSCLNFILLHRIVEKIAEQPLDVYAQENTFAPLGLTDTMYRPSEHLHRRIAPTVPQEGPNKGERLVGTVHDGNARGIGGVSGNAGLFGTAKDVATFGEALRAGRLFGAPTRARIFENQVDPAVGAHTFLFFAQGNGFCPAGDLLSPRAVGHSGFTGTVLTIDPAHDLTVAVLTNSVFGDGKPGWLNLRRRFLNALASALE